MDDRINDRLMWAITISGIVAVLTYLIADLVVAPLFDQPLVERIKQAAYTELAGIPGPAELVFQGIEMTSGSDSVSVYARYGGVAPASTIREFYDKTLPVAGWATGDRAGYYNRDDFCVRVIQHGQLGIEVELAWRHEWCSRGGPVPLFAVATKVAGLGQLGLVLSWPWLEYVRKADPGKLGNQVVNDPTFRLKAFRTNPEVGTLAAWSSAISGVVLSVVLLVIAGVLVANSWLLMMKWR